MECEGCGEDMDGNERLTRHKFNNVLQSALLLGGVTLLMVLLGWTAAGAKGVLWAVVAGAFLMWLNPRLSPRLVLRLYGVQPLSRDEAPGLYAIVEELAQRAGLPRVPVLCCIRTPTTNAFTVGSRHESAIGMTDGLLLRLSTRELAGVLAHEIGHIRNNDMWVMGLADLVSRMTNTLSFFGQLLMAVNLPLLLFGADTMPWPPILMLVAAPTVMVLLQLALSRQREYDADLDGARLTGDPLGLAFALEKLEHHQGSRFEKIFFLGRGLPNLSLLRTHPKTAERVRRLRSIAGDPAVAQHPIHIPPDFGRDVPHRAKPAAHQP